MDILSTFLDHRENDPRNKRERRRDAAISCAEALAIGDPAMKKVQFDAYVRRQIAARLTLPEDSAKRARLIGQIAEMVETMQVHLYQRNWLLDGKRLAVHVVAALDEIAKAQQAGRVRDLYKFAEVVICRYVGTHAEEIQAEARWQEGAAVALAQANALFRDAPLVELAARRREANIKEALAAARKAQEQAEE